MLSATRVAGALVAGAGMLCAAHVATAEESGTLRIIRTYVQDYTTIDHAGGSVTGGPLEGTVTVLESSGGPFVAGAHQRITCVVYAKSTQAGIDLDAPCTMTAASGDTWYTHSKRRAGDVETGGGGPGTMEILGGTGVYEGIGGTCTYDVGYLPDNWVSMIADCTWQR